MKVERISTETDEQWLELRTKDLTSTEISALFGCSPYMTPFELWQRKAKNMRLDLEPNERMNWGNRLQDAIAVGLNEEHGWVLRRINQYFRLPELRLGSSFDYKGKIQEVPGSTVTNESFLVEIKNVDGLVFRYDWPNGEAPLHIEIQLQHQLLVSGMKKGYIAALVGGNKMHLIERIADEKVHAEILARSAEFWRTVDANEEPSPDWVADSAFIMELYKRTAPGKEIEASPEVADLAIQHKSFLEAEKKADEQKGALKAQIVVHIGDAEKVRGDGFVISAKQKKDGSRDFRINWTPKEGK
jgi:putative phage-type endonuclease